MPRRIHLALSASALLGCASEGHGHHHRAHSGSHRFEDAEQWAKTFDDPSRDQWQRPDEVVALMSIEPGMVVADLGAGTGYFLARLSRAVGPAGRVFGLDVEPDMIRYMSERVTKDGLGNVSPRQVAFDDPGLSPDSVDRVLIVDTWHHIEDRIPYSLRLAASLRPGARLYIVDFTMEAERGPPVAHRITPDQVRVELEAAGLEVAFADEGLPEQYVVIGTKPGPRTE